jgi:hypothetical protein
MSRLSRRARRLASVAAATVLLSGCAVHRADVPSAAAGGRPIVRPGRPGVVVAAPPGLGDADTITIAAEIARRTGFGLVVADGVVRDADGRADEVYERQVLEAARGPLRFFAEIDGGHGAPCAGQIEIATVGVDVELARRWRALAELIRDAHLRANPEIPSLAVLVGPADAVTSRTTGARPDAIRLRPERALHIELPACGRRDWREAYTAILAEFLAQTLTLPAGR